MNYPSISGFYDTTITLLIALTGILIAVLSLWAQLSARLIQFNQQEIKYKNLTISLMWIYMAIIIGMLAIGFFTLSYFLNSFTNNNYAVIYGIGLGCIFTAFFMAIQHIVESFISLIRRGRKRKTIVDPLISNICDNQYKKVFIIIPITVTIMLVSAILVCWLCQYSTWFFLIAIIFVGIVIYQIILYKKLT